MYGCTVHLTMVHPSIISDDNVSHLHRNQLQLLGRGRGLASLLLLGVRMEEAAGELLHRAVNLGGPLQAVYLLVVTSNKPALQKKNRRETFYCL